MIQSQFNRLLNGRFDVNLCRIQGWLCGLSACSTVTRRKGWAEGWTAYDPHKQRLRPTVQPVQPNRACARAYTRVKLRHHNQYHYFLFNSLKKVGRLDIDSIHAAFKASNLFTMSNLG